VFNLTTPLNAHLCVAVVVAGPRERMTRQLGFVDELTSISDRLCAVDRSQRNRQLREMLETLNKNLPTDDHPLWCPLMPLTPADEPAHRVLRLLPEEAFVLSTKVRPSIRRLIRRLIRRFIRRFIRR